jgi:acetyl-CoA carboxylase carboxyl transferase subunit beta
MNWLTNFVRPKLRALVSKRQTPDNLWDKCPSCGQMIFHRDLETNLKVCPQCDHHLRLTPPERLGQIFDDGAYQRVALPDVPADPIRFRDSKRYTDRIRESRSRTGESEAMVVATGRIGGTETVLAVQNFYFMGGSMGLAVGEALIAAAEESVRRRSPLVVFAAAGGARMQEGILSLMQMPRTTIAIRDVRSAGLPFVTVLTDPTTGGVTASYAMLGDVAIAEPGALIGFAGPRVIENTIRESLPEGFQRAEYLLEHGMLDLVVHRHRLRETLGHILAMLCDRRSNTPSGADAAAAAPGATPVAGGVDAAQ